MTKEQALAQAKAEHPYASPKQLLQYARELVKRK